MLRWLAVSSLIVAVSLGAAARTRPHYGGVLRVQTAGTADELARRLVLENLTRVDEEGNAQPWLAARWASQNDDTRWQFWLRPGVSFHDGSQLTPAAVVQALSVARCDACAWRSVRVLGESILFETDAPVHELPALLALPRFAIARSANPLVGTGSFRVESVTNGTVTLVAYEDAWTGRPYIDRMEIQEGRGIRDQWTDLSYGRADVVEVTPEQLRRTTQEGKQILASRPQAVVVLKLSEGSTALQDTRLRTALASTLDRSSLFNVIFQKQGEITAGLLPSWISGYSFLFPTAANPQRARELKSQAAPPGTLRLAVDPTDTALQLAAERLALNAREAKFDVQVVNGAPADMTLERVPLESTNADVLLREFGAVSQSDDADARYRAERDLLLKYRVIPLVCLPRAYAAGVRVHGIALDALGFPQYAGAWMEATK